MIFIIIPVFNRIAFTIACLRSLQQQTVNQFKIIVVDHGSTDGTYEIISDEFPDVIIVKGDSNLWWTGATNLGLSVALQMSNSDEDFVLTLNNDLVVKNDYLENLIGLVNSKKVLVGSVSVDINNPNRIAFAGTKWNRFNAKYRSAINLMLPYSILCEQQEYIESAMLPGRGTLIPIKAFREVGYYDDISFPHYAADEDFSLRCYKKGFRIIVSTRACVKSHIHETGMNYSRKDLNLKQYLQILTSIKSPANIKRRWLWAKRHAAIPPLYFLFDFIRITVSFLRERGLFKKVRYEQ